MSDELKHECGIAHIRLLKSLDFYKKKIWQSILWNKQDVSANGKTA